MPVVEVWIKWQQLEVLPKMFPLPQPEAALEEGDPVWQMIMTGKMWVFVEMPTGQVIRAHCEPDNTVANLVKGVSGGAWDYDAIARGRILKPDTLLGDLKLFFYERIHLIQNFEARHPANEEIWVKAAGCSRPVSIHWGDQYDTVFRRAFPSLGWAHVRYYHGGKPAEPE